METRLRENAAREVEFITVDKSYKPATTWWGVFERPADISAAFGGGRNLQPGAPLETEEAAATRLAGVRTAMQAFRKAQGLDLPPEIEAGIAMHMEQGEAAFEAGRLERAAVSFRAAAELAPLRSQPGGNARIRLAVCLDSTGKTAEAKELYTALSAHPNVEVNKQAKRLLWGMTEATQFLKAEAFDYDGGVRSEYQKYLEQLVNPWDVVVGENEEETKQLNALAAASIVMLMALPVSLLAVARAAAEAHRVAVQ